MLSAADIHVVPLRTGLGSVSVPSKTYSILAVGKPVIAAIDEGSAVARLLADANAGVSIPPDDVGALLDAVDALVGDRKRCEGLGAHGPQWVADHASPAAASMAYEKVLAGEQTG